MTSGIKATACSGARISPICNRNAPVVIGAEYSPLDGWILEIELPQLLSNISSSPVLCLEIIAQIINRGIYWSIFRGTKSDD
jgi:hypothetical protein